MGGRGSSSGGGSYGNTSTLGIVTQERSKKANQIANRTRNLKNEQYRVIDENGNVVLEKKGEEHQVARTAGESRETIPGSVTIHNHPNGGTFSDADIRDFGYGARAIYVASPEGTYRLVNTKYDTSDRYNGWVEMQEAYKAQVGQERSSLYYRDKAKATPTAKRLNAQMEKTSQAWVEARKQGKSESVLDSYKKQYDKLADQYTAYMKAETRRQEVAPADKFFRKNASKYGFSYSFVKK